ncbi:MAG: alpha/beta hydrolase, partial [Chloroflexota bacterium]
MSSIGRLLVIACLFCLGAADVLAQQTGGIPRIEATECQFDDRFLDVTCLDLVTLEDHADPLSTEIRLHVAIFRSYSANPQPDPIVYLEGGPGADALFGVEWAYPILIEPFLAERDFIIFDQRGTGYSWPTLRCEEYDNMQYDILDENLPAEENIRLSVEAMDRCRQRLESRGYDLSAYTSAQSAADLNDLRLVLGYDEWNLYGISYGTRLALTAMRDYPEGIRSVVIDSVLPPQVSMFDELAQNADRAFNTLFLNCAMDAACNEAYPRLGTVFYEAVAQLNAEPAQMYILHPTSEREVEVLVNGDRLIGLTFLALYSESLIPYLPRIIYDARDGNYGLLASTMESVLLEQEGFSMGMNFSVQCMEEAPFTTLDSVIASHAVYPASASYFQISPNTGEIIFSVCDAWRGDTPPLTIENEPVFSDIPTLVMSGEYDPITPPRWAEIAAATLPNGYFFNIPAVGHGASVSHQCPLDMMQAFLSNPQAAPNSNCISTIDPIEFYIPEAVSTRTVAFTDPISGISSVRPEGWDDFGDGTFMREDLTSMAMLFFMTVPDVSSDRMLRDIAQEFDIYVTPDAVDTRNSNGFLWQVYEFRDAEFMLNVAIAERNETSFIVGMLNQRF